MRRSRKLVAGLTLLGVLAACQSSPGPGVRAGAATRASVPPATLPAGSGPDPAPAITTSPPIPPATGATDPAGTTTLPGRVIATTLPADPASTVAVSTTSPGSATFKPDDQHAADYVGAVVGSVPTGEPIVFGYVNQEGGAPTFPDATLGLNVALQYVNELLGGAAGRPLQVHVCAVQREEDGQRCAEQMLNDAAVRFVVTGVLAVGTGPFLAALSGKKPVLLSNPLTTPEYLATDAYAYTPGTPGVVQGLALYATNRLPGGPPAKVAVLFPDGVAGTAAYHLLVEPIMQKAGIPVVPVPIPDGARAEEYADVVRAAGAADASVVIPILTVQGCVGTAQALHDLGSSAAVLTTGLCQGAALTDWVRANGGSGSLPDGWYYGSNGYSWFIGGNLDQDTYVRVATRFEADTGLRTIDFTGFAGPVFATVLTATRFIDAIGADALTPEAFRQQARSFPGPMWGVVGPMRCGANLVYPSLCGTQMGIQQYRNGVWVSVADGYNGGSVDLSSVLAG